MNAGMTTSKRICARDDFATCLLVVFCLLLAPALLHYEAREGPPSVHSIQKKKTTRSLQKQPTNHPQGKCFKIFKFTPWVWKDLFYDWLRHCEASGYTKKSDSNHQIMVTVGFLRLRFITSMFGRHFCEVGVGVFVSSETCWYFWLIEFLYWKQ